MITTLLIALLSPSFSHADNSDIIVEMSAYDPCEGGGDKAAYSKKLTPSRNNLHSKSDAVMLAVPPGSPLKGQCFTAVGGIGDDKRSRKFVSKLSGRTFVAADYCPQRKPGKESGCTNEEGKVRIDVATACYSSRNALAKSVHLKPTRCPDKIYEAIYKDHRQENVQTAMATEAGR